MLSERIRRGHGLGRVFPLRLLALPAVAALLVSLALALPATSGAAGSHASKLTVAGLTYMTAPVHGPSSDPVYPPPHVWVATTDGLDRHNLGGGQQPLLSPSGRYVAAISNAESRGVIFYRSAGGLAGRLHGLLNASPAPVAWSSNSRYLAVTWTTFKNNHSKSGLDIVSVPSGKIVATVHGTIFNASFAPTGPQRVVFADSPSELTTANTNLEVLTDQGGHWRITSTLIRHKNVGNPLWGRYGIVYDRIFRGKKYDGPLFQLVLLRHGHETQITHTVQHGPVDGLVATAFSKSGKQLIANFTGTDTYQAYSVNLVTHKLKLISIMDHSILDQEVSGYGISPNGRTLLVDYGAFQSPSNTARIATIPFAGGTPKVLVHGGVDPGWRN